MVLQATFLALLQPHLCCRACMLLDPCCTGAVSGAAQQLCVHEQGQPGPDYCQQAD